MNKATIFVRTIQDGLHCWPQAPEHRSYLRLLHRHLFHIEVTTEVDHDDREIEFHDLLEQVVSIWKGFTSYGAANLGAASCEQLARTIGMRLAQAHKRRFDVMVSEDGECGATVISLPTETGPGVG